MFRLFSRDRRGSVTILFAFALVPLLVVGGAAIEYSRSTRLQADLQSAVDGSRADRRAEYPRQGTARPRKARAQRLRRGVPFGRRDYGYAVHGDAELGPHRGRGGRDLADDLRRVPRQARGRPLRQGRGPTRYNGPGGGAGPRQHRLDQPPRQDGRAEGGGEEPPRHDPGGGRKT